MRIKPAVMTIEAPSPSIHPKSRAAWRAWLQRQHLRAAGVWLITFKKGTGKPRVEYDAAVEEALCFGWIDSKPSALDDERSMLWFSPRKPRSGWSKPNKQRVARLTAAGLMAEAGLAVIRAAKRNGSWTALDAVEALEIPPDLKRALAAQPPATENFAAFPRSVKRGILEWIQSAKRPETRAVRVQTTADMARRNERANQWRGPAGRKQPGAT
jgi:uncharacterized protein YdeI (YjbR/CyaY-like superfamily)